MDHLFQVFHFRVDRENRAQHMFSQDVVTTIFSNIKSIYLFHAEHVLPQVSREKSYSSVFVYPGQGSVHTCLCLIPSLPLTFYEKFWPTGL